MRHRPFLDTLTRLDPQSSEAMNVSAGFLALRQLDVWLDHPGLMDEGNLTATLSRVEQAQDPVRSLLGSAVKELGRSHERSVVLGTFMAYGVWLTEQFQKDLAADVFETLIEAVDPSELLMSEEPWFAATCHFHLGTIHVFRGRWDAVEKAFARVRALLAGDSSDAARDLMTHAEIYTCIMWSLRGNLGDAYSRISDLLTRVEMGNPVVQWRALLTRGGLSHRRSETSLALEDFYQAYRVAETKSARQLVLGDIAACLFELGVADQAVVHIHGYLARRGVTPYVRALATTNLLEIYALHARDTVLERASGRFEAWWTQFQALEHPTAEIRWQGELYHAMAVERWQGALEAVREYSRVAEGASAAGVHRITNEALEAIDRLQRSSDLSETFVTPASEPKQLPGEVLTRTISIAADVDAYCVTQMLEAGDLVYASESETFR